MAGTTKPPDEVHLRRQENAGLRTQVAWFKQRMFGGGKSEKLAPAQLPLKLTQVEEAQAAVAEHTQKIAYERAAKKPPRPTPAETFAHVPVTETLELVPDAVRRDPE